MVEAKPSPRGVDKVCQLTVHTETWHRLGKPYPVRIVGIDIVVEGCNLRYPKSVVQLKLR